LGHLGSRRLPQQRCSRLAKAIALRQQLPVLSQPLIELREARIDLCQHTQ
jgi:hypothetical protein